MAKALIPGIPPQPSALRLQQWRVRQVLPVKLKALHAWLVAATKARVAERMSLMRLTPRHPLTTTRTDAASVSQA